MPQQIDDPNVRLAQLQAEIREPDVGRDLPNLQTLRAVLVVIGLRAVVVRLFNQLKARWPHFQVDIDSETDQPSPGEFRQVTELPRDRGEFYVVRDAEMDRFSDDHAYALMSDGEGPFLLVYDRLQNVDFRVESVVESASPPGEIGAPDLYSARLCCPQIWQFTLVTPDEPSKHSLSDWLYRLLCNQCLANDIRWSSNG